MLDEAINYKEKCEDIFVKYTHLQHELDQIKRLVFGSRHERFVPSVPQEQLALGLNVAATPTTTLATETVSYTRTKTTSLENVNTGRMKLPSDLPREQIIIEPGEDVSGMKEIGKEITEQLEYAPGKLFVRQYVRIKYARANGEGIVIGELPVRPIDKGIAGPGLLAQIIIDKYTDHHYHQNNAIFFARKNQFLFLKILRRG